MNWALWKNLVEINLVSECTVLSIDLKIRFLSAWVKMLTIRLDNCWFIYILSSSEWIGLCGSRKNRSLGTFSIFPGVCLDILCSVTTDHVIQSFLSPSFPVYDFFSYWFCSTFALLTFSLVAFSINVLFFFTSLCLAYP